MLYMIKADVNKPADMSNKEFYGLWLEEAEAAVAAMKQGVFKALYKVPGKPQVIGVLDVDSHDTIEAAVLSLPFWKQGYSHIVDLEWTPLRPYENWHEDLKKLATE